MSADGGRPHGLYGKIPSKADFVHRDLPRAFVSPWDQWLQHSLAASRQAIGEGWMAAYLASPPWRFALDAGIAGPLAWAGVLVSSVDQVHRCFPLTLAVALPAGTSIAGLRADLNPPLGQLEHLAFELVADDRAIDDALADVSAIADHVGHALASPAALHLWRDGRTSARIDRPGVPSVGAMLGERMIDGRTTGLSCWWHCGWGGRQVADIVAYGLPPVDGFAAFLDGQWDAHGWRPA